MTPPDAAVVFRDAGGAPRSGDRLGRLALTDAELRARDARVLGWARGRGLAVAGGIGGGYDDAPERLAARQASGSGRPPGSPRAPDRATADRARLIARG